MSAPTVRVVHPDQMKSMKRSAVRAIVREVLHSGRSQPQSAAGVTVLYQESPEPPRSESVPEGAEAREPHANR